MSIASMLLGFGMWYYVSMIGLLIVILIVYKVVRSRQG